MNKLLYLLLDPPPLRIFIRKIIKKLKFGSYKFRYKLNAIERPHYAYILYQAAALGKALKHKTISVIEFGVAKGDGLINLEMQAKEISKLFGINIVIYGFDNATGLPTPEDYRDCPYLWSKGLFRMDEKLLRSKLKNSKLIIGDIKDTAKSFFDKHNPAPIGAIIYDFDFYTPTAIALNILNNDSKFYLPRIFNYFDNTLGNNKSCFNEFTGERLAIKEFNENNEKIKIAQPYNLIPRDNFDLWYKQIWITHIFNHKDYCKYIGDKIEK